MNSPESLQDIIYSILGNHKALNGSTLISDLEFDSISTLDLFNQIDQLYNIEISVDEFLTCKNISDLQILIQHKIDA